jgi:hypothetical protein
MYRILFVLSVLPTIKVNPAKESPINGLHCGIFIGAAFDTVHEAILKELGYVSTTQLISVPVHHTTALVTVIADS